MKPKTFLYILVIIAIIAVGTFIAYQLVYHKSGIVTPVETGKTGTLPITVNQQFPSGTQVQTSTVGTFGASGTNTSSSRFGVISNDQTLDYFVDAANIVTLVKTDGTLESVMNGKTSILSGSAVPNIMRASFSYDGKKVFVVSLVGTTTQSSVFDIATKTWMRLPDGMQSPVWSPTNYQIAYLIPSNSGSETLMTIDAGTTNAKPVSITLFSMEDMLLQWPDKNTIVISDHPSAYTTGSIWLLNLSSKSLALATHEDLGIESLWSASDSALIFSAGSNNSGGNLVFRDAGGIQKILSFATLPSKCAFGSSLAATGTDIIYCAVPSDQATFSIARLPDEYDQRVYFMNDDLYSIDAATGLLAKIFSSSSINQNFDASGLKVFNNVLFFINRYDQKVYAIAL